MSSAFKKVGIIGNGRMAKECAVLLNAFDPSGCKLVRVVVDGSKNNISADFEKYCQNMASDYIVSDNINNDETLAYLNSGDLDFVFSINNHQIIRDALLAIPVGGIINFHNGPLPRYGGLNACSWAIYNGEIHHGVTWHYVSQGVDNGDIIAQRCFDIEPDSTALKLVMKCINEGIGLFKEILPSILVGENVRIEQDPTKRLFYYSRQIPGEGVIDFSGDYASIDRLVRALNYNPLANPLGNPCGMVNGKVFYVDKVRLARPVLEGIPGQVLCTKDRFEIQVRDAVIEIVEIRDEMGMRVPVKRLIDKYDIMPGMKTEKR